MGHVVSFSVPKEDVAWVERFLQEQKNKGVDKSKVVMTALRRYAETVVHIEDKGSLEEQVEERTEEQRIDIEEQLQRKEEDPSDHKKNIPFNLFLI